MASQSFQQHTYSKTLIKVFSNCIDKGDLCNQSQHDHDMKACIQKIKNDKNQTLRIQHFDDDLEHAILHINYLEYLNKNCAYYEYMWNSHTIKLKNCKNETQKKKLRSDVLYFHDMIQKITEEMFIVLNTHDILFKYINTYSPHYLGVNS